MFPIKVVQDILVCKQDTQETSKGGIILVDEESKKLRYATVVAAGPGKKVDGQFVPNEFKEGHRIAFGRYKSGGYGDEPFILDGVEYILLRSGDVIGFVADEEITIEAPVLKAVA